MIYLQAPWNIPKTTIMLPSPDLGDLTQPALDVVIRNSTNGEIYSYTKINNRIKKSWTIKMNRQKSEEFRLFAETYIGYEWRVIDWNDVSYRMHLISNPFEIPFVNRAGWTVVNIELEGVAL